MRHASLASFLYKLIAKMSAGECPYLPRYLTPNIMLIDEEAVARRLARNSFAAFINYLVPRNEAWESFARCSVSLLNQLSVKVFENDRVDVLNNGCSPSFYSSSIIPTGVYFRRDLKTEIYYHAGVAQNP